MITAAYRHVIIFFTKNILKDLQLLVYFCQNLTGMDFKLTEEHLMIRQAARDFANQECLPGVIERDEKMIFPKEQIAKLAELGFLGMMVNPKYGGAGLDYIPMEL